MDRSRLHILIVDDEPFHQELIAMALETGRHQFTFSTVGTGAEALAYLAGEGPYADTLTAPRPDLILLDILMPELDGIETLRRIKADPDCSEIPVVMVSTLDSPKTIATCRELGASGYITKPNNIDGYLDTVRSIEDLWPNLPGSQLLVPPAAENSLSS